MFFSPWFSVKSDTKVSFLCFPCKLFLQTKDTTVTLSIGKKNSIYGMGIPGLSKPVTAPTLLVTQNDTALMALVFLHTTQTLIEKINSVAAVRSPNHLSACSGRASSQLL